MGDDGYPVLARARAAERDGDGFRLALPRGLPPPSGPACSTFYAHPERFTGRENRGFVGRVDLDNGLAAMRVERQLADWSLGGPARPARAHDPAAVNRAA